ncbi:ArsR/SmtB family transcription factor [Actinoplanes sp. CA-030573]|uniref:ArsR/SmtB family transcription factor n=1 Tax=Actinoplanes sp. CA-030573 TaxID=3239898 RepID=UPI003D8A6BF0
MAEGRAGSDGIRVSDPRVMRALAHPARIEIVEYLNDTGAVVTATEVAGMVGLSPSATSYHLRELAKYGLVEQAPSRGDGRERVWRSTSSTGLRIDADFEQPGVRAATQALVDLYLNRDLDRMRNWIAKQGDEPREWAEASAIMGQRLLLTADELKELNQRIRELTDPYRMRDRQDEAPEGARRVSVSYAAIPED